MNRTIIAFAGMFSVSSLLLVDSTIKGTAIMVVAAIVAMLLNRDSAATRHLVWLLAVVALLVVPVLSATLPEWQILPQWASVAPQSIVAEPDALSMDAPLARVSEWPQRAEPVDVGSTSVSPAPFAPGNQPFLERTVTSPAPAASEIRPAPMVENGSWFDALTLVWAIGFCTFLLRLLAARLLLWKTERHGTTIWSSKRPEETTHDPIVMALEAAYSQLGIDRPVTLLIHPDKTIPVIWGILRSRLLLPAAARHWSGEQLRSVLLHELAHVKRRDTLSQLLAQIACVLHWFNPLVWFAAWRLGVERERACDDLVLASGVRPSAYAEHLLDAVTLNSPARWMHSSGLAMARKSSLEGRLVAVLSQNRNRRGVSVALAALALIIAVGVAIPLAMLRAANDEFPRDDVKPATLKTDSTPEKPNDTTAAVLLKRWQELEGRDSTLSEESLVRLRRAIDKWVKQGPPKDEMPLILALRDRYIERAEHPVREVAAWLDEIAAIHRGPLEFAINGEIRVGATLSKERAAALKFGPVAENGLRAAWSRYPERETYVVGDIINSTLVIQNASKATIEFQCPYSLDDIVSWKASTEDGQTIETKTTQSTGTIPVFKWRLKPGEVAEIGGRGAAIGEGETREQVTHFPISTVIHAQRGDRVNLHWDVREPVAMSTADVSFQVVGVEDVAVWSTSRAGKWRLSGGVRMEVKQELVHATDVASKAILTWPPNETGAIVRHTIWLAGDAFANREPWLLAWERDASVLWAMQGDMQSPQDFRKIPPTPRFLRRIDFSDKSGITTATWSYLPESVPDGIRAEFLSVFKPFATTPPTPDQSQGSIQTSEGAKLPSGIEEQLQWGEPTNGMRAALVRPQALGEPAAGEIFDFRFVVQNVSEEPIRLSTASVAPTRRYLLLREKGVPLSAMSDAKPTRADFLIQPREVAVLRMFSESPQGNSIAGGPPVMTFSAEFNIENAPEGSWTGKLVAAEMQAATVGYGLLPKNQDARALFILWNAGARRNEKIPGGLIGLLAESVKQFTEYNPTWKTTPQLLEMLPRLDASRDWTGQEAIALLDELAEVQDSPIKAALEHEQGARALHTGTPLPPELKNAPWGRVHLSGLRLAWLLEPRAAEHHLNTPLKSRILVYNVSKYAVVFRTENFHQVAHSATDANGAKVDTESTYWTTLGRFLPYRLAPGEYVELYAPGIGVGANKNYEDWQNTRVGTWIDAKAGDEVTVTTNPIPFYDGIEQPPTDHESGWWLDFIKARLARYEPLPDDAEERKLLLYRVAMELFGTPVSAEITNSFVEDREPTALDSLAKRLHDRSGTTPFTGSLVSGPTTFRVLPVDPEAAKRPRTVHNPGWYTLGEKIVLSVTRRPVGERIVNEASIRFYSDDPNKPAPGEPYQVKLPNGYGTWAAGWMRQETMLWVQEKSGFRRIDFSNPVKVKEEVVEPDQVPADLRVALASILTKAQPAEGASRIPPPAAIRP